MPMTLKNIGHVRFFSKFGAKYNQNIVQFSPKVIYMRRVFNRKNTHLVCKVASSQFDRQKSRRFGFEATFSRFHMVKILGWHFEVKIVLGNL